MLCALGIVATIILTGVIGIVLFNKKENCSSIELREQRLGQLDYLGIVNIDSEITIDRHIISGYTSSNGSYGVAVFEPAYRGNYKFQSNINSSGSEILVTTIIINGVVYDLFRANIADLDFAQITYVTSSDCKEYKLDASNNEVLYLQAPYDNYTVSAVFYNQNGDYHE